MSGIAPRVLIVGPVTWDVFDGECRPGGSVSFAARVAAAMGVPAAILTVAAAGADLAALEGHPVTVVEATSTLTFQHRRRPDGRELRVIEAPDRPLTIADIPPTWTEASLLLLAPLLPDDIDFASFAGFEAPQGRALLAQGLQRQVRPDGAVVHSEGPSEALRAALRPDTSVFLSAEEIANWCPADVDAVVRQSARLVLTHGTAGAEVRRGRDVFTIPPAPATAVDTTGAGDVFAAAFILALNEGEAAAGRIASAFAAAKVERVGPAPLPTRPVVMQRYASTEATSA